MLSQTQASQFSMFRYGLLSSMGNMERRAESLQALAECSQSIMGWDRSAVVQQGPRSLLPEWSQGLAGR